MYNYFELFQENRIFEILYPPFALFNKLDLKSKEEEEAQVALQTWQKCDVLQSNYIVKLESLFLISSVSSLWSQTPASTGKSGVSRLCFKF